MHKQKQSYGTNNKTKVKKQSCTHCGWKNQKPNFCKFKAATCHSCNKKGHLSTVCRGKVKSIGYVEGNANNSCEFDYNDKLKDVIGNFDYSICSVEPEKEVHYIPEVESKNILKPCHISFYEYGGNPINFVGEYCTNVRYKGQCKSIIFIITNTKTQPLLGRNFFKSI